MLQYIYGYHPVEMALEPDSLVKVKQIIMLEGKYKPLEASLKKLNIPFKYVSLERMNNVLQTTKHQGICAEVKDYRYFDINEIYKRQPKHHFFRLMICDKITDPHNFGSILRIAAGNDFDAVVVLNRNQVPVNSVVAKAAAGALSLIPIVEVNNLSVLLNNLKQKQFWTLAAAKTEKAVSFETLAYDFNLALIIGNEGEGVSNNILKQSDYIVEIPMSSKMESFNASVACGVLASDIYLKTIKLNTKK